MNIDNRATFGFILDSEIKHSNAVSGGQSMALMVRTAGGPLFPYVRQCYYSKNKNRCNPIFRVRQKFQMSDIVALRRDGLKDNATNKGKRGESCGERIPLGDSNQYRVTN